MIELLPAALRVRNGMSTIKELITASTMVDLGHTLLGHLHAWCSGDVDAVHHCSSAGVMLGLVHTSMGGTGLELTMAFFEFLRHVNFLHTRVSCFAAMIHLSSESSRALFSVLFTDFQLSMDLLFVRKLI